MSNHDALSSTPHHNETGTVPPTGFAGRSVSLAIVVGLLGVADGLAIFVSGIAPLLWPSLRHGVGSQAVAVARPFGTLLGGNVLHFVGCYPSQAMRVGKLAMSQAATAWVMALLPVISSLYPATG